MKNTKRSQRILGMTVLQLIVLACLACAAFGVLGFGGWFVINGSQLPASNQPIVQVPFVGATPTPPPPTATATVTSTPTETPYEASIPQGWSQYITDQYEIWLPAEFVVESSDDYNKSLIQGLSKLGQTDLAQQIQDNPPQYTLTFHKNTPGQFIETAIYLKQQPLTDGDFETYVDTRFSNLPVTYTFVQRKDFPMYHAQGVRATLQANFNTTSVGYVYYMVQDGDVAWEIGCNATLDNFYTLLPTFDQIAETFRTLP